MSKTVRFKLYGEVAKASVNIANELGVPLDALAYNLYLNGLNSVVANVLTKPVTESSPAVAPVRGEGEGEAENDVVHTAGNPEGSDTQSGSEGSDTSVQS
jgi:hypothetical protein